MPTHTCKTKRRKPATAAAPRRAGRYTASIRRVQRRITRDANALLQQGESQADPAQAKFYACVCQAFGAAVEIARQSRIKAPSPTEIMLAYLRLDVFLKRLDGIPNPIELWARWPTTPGVSFSWKAGDSALHVAYQFSRMIRAAGGFLRNVRCDRCWARACTNPADPSIVQWCDAALEQLQTKTLPPPADWPMWKIHRDTSALEAHLYDEWRRTQTATPERDVWRSPITLDGLTARCDGQTYPLTEDQARILGHIIDAKGGWVSGTTMKVCHDGNERPDRIVAGLPAAIGKYIKPKPGHGGGFRLLVEQ